MTPDELMFGYVAILLTMLAGLAVYSELRRRRFGPMPTEDHIFRCVECGYVYTDDPDVDRSRCPHCGRMNDLMQF